MGLLYSLCISKYQVDIIQRQTSQVGITVWWNAIAIGMAGFVTAQC